MTTYNTPRYELSFELGFLKKHCDSFDSDMNGEDEQKYLNKIKDHLFGEACCPGAWNVFEQARQSENIGGNDIPCLNDDFDFYKGFEMMLAGLDYWDVNEFVYTNESASLMGRLADFAKNGWKIKGMKRYTKTNPYSGETTWHEGILMERGWQGRL